MEQAPKQPLTADELLQHAEQSLVWARNNYGGQYNELANTAALVSLAASGLVIARSIVAQTEMMAEVYVPDVGSQASEQAGK